ncbi:AI-2E family transporter [Nocardioides salsibiostraticola]
MDPTQAPTPTSTPEHDLPTREHLIGAGITWSARWSLRWVAIALGAIVVGLIVMETWTILLPVFLALIICTVLAPISIYLRRRWKLPPALAAFVAMLGPIAALVGLGFALAPSVAGQSNALATATVEGLQSIQDWVLQEGFMSSTEIGEALQSLQDGIQGETGTIAVGLLTGVTTVTNLTVTFVVTLALTFLFLKDGPAFVPWVRHLAGGHAGAHLAEVFHRCWVTLGGFIRAQAIVSFLDAVFIGTALLIVGVPLAIPLAVLTFFGGFVPIVGAFVAGGVAVLVALVSLGWKGALIVFVVIVVVQQVEGNILSPMLQSRSMQLHSAVVLLSVLLGSTLFGIVGAFFAVPLMAVVAVILRYLDEQVAARSEPPMALQEPEADEFEEQEEPV